MKSLLFALLIAFFTQCLYPSLSFAQSHSRFTKTMLAKAPISVIPVVSAGLPAVYKTYRAGSIYTVKLDKTRLKAMKIGDKFKLHLSQDEYTVVHDNRMSHPNGDLTWVGYLQEAGQDYRLTVTLGKQSLTGQLTTPKASYQLEQQQQRYWLVNRDAAGLKEMPSHQDALMPPVPAGSEKVHK